MEENQLLAEETLTNKLIKKSFWLYLFTILTVPIGYIVKVIVSNELSVADIGVFYSILGFVIIVSMYNDLGLTEALQYFIPKYWIEKKYNNYKTILYFTMAAQLISGIIIAGIIYFGATRLAVNHFHSPDAVDIIKIFCIYFIGINFLQVFSSIYIAFQDTFATSLIEAIRMYSILLFTIIFRLSQTLTNVTFTLSWMLGLFLSLLASTIIFFKKYSYTLKKGQVEFSASLIKKQISYAFWVFLGANVGVLLAQVSQQMIINFLGPEPAGYYANYMSLIGVSGMIIGPILVFIFPIVTEFIVKKDNLKLALFQNVMYKYFSLFTLSVSGILLVFGKEIAAILFGSKFAYSGELISYTAPFLILSTLIGVNYGILGGLGKVKERVKILTLALIVTVSGNILFIYIIKLGLIGAVISSVLGRIVLWLLSFRIIHKHQKIWFDWKHVGINMAIISVLVAICFSIKNDFFVLDNIYRFKNIFYLSIFVITYYVVLSLANYKHIKLLIIELKGIIKKDKPKSQITEL